MIKRACFLLLLAVPAAQGARGIGPLVEQLEAIRDRYQVAGFAVTLVDAGGQVEAGGAGVADRETGRPVTPDTLWRIGSITKTFNALVFFMLAEEGGIDLDAPVRSLAPRVPIVNPWEETDPVRVVHLLEHTSGMLDLSREEFDHNRPFASLEDALACRPEAREVQWPPGLHRVYSNANAGLAGYVLEQVTAKPWGDLVSGRLLGPLRMTSAGTELDDATAARLATGYDRDGETVIPYWHMIFPPLGAVNATPREMAALVALFLGRGETRGRRLLSAESIARMERVASTLAGRSGLDYGYGPGLDQWLHKGFRFFGHGGDGDGYLSRFGYSRDAGRGYFVAINAFNREALRAMAGRVQDWLLDGVEPPAVPGAAAMQRKDLAALAGTYRRATRRFPWEPPPSRADDRIVVGLDSQGLHTGTGDERRRLIPVSARHFRRSGQPVATVAFVAHDGVLYMQGDFGNYRRVSGLFCSEMPSAGGIAGDRQATEGGSEGCR